MSLCKVNKQRAFKSLASIPECNLNDLYLPSEEQGKRNILKIQSCNSIMQIEHAHTGCRTRKQDKPTRQNETKMCLCNVNLHIPAAEQENEKRRHVRTK
jgi:hypothetical protein